MAKHKNEEAFYQRMNQLAQSGKATIKESRTLGTLVDVKHAADGVAYGIVKEQHQYYIKKGGLKQNPNVADFAYIGGLSNITEHQYPSLAVADKNRNFLLATINEGLSRVSKTGSKKDGKKGMLTEDKAAKEIGDAEAAFPKLQAATDAETAVADDGAAEMAAGVEAMPGAGVAADPLADAGAEVADAGADPLAADVGADPLAGDVGADPLAGDAGEFGAEPNEDEGSTPLQKKVSELAKEIQDTELEKGETKWLLDRFLRAFLPVAGVSEAEEEVVATDAPVEEPVAEPAAEDNKMADLEIEDRQELADMILNVVPDEDIADLGQNVEDTDGDGIPDSEETEVPMEEEECSECGGFAQYAESRGYTAESIMECGEEEMTNMISGYANAHDEGQNDGDFKVVALLITPEILEKLKSEYGHDEFANQVEPFSKEMNEDDKSAQIAELFGGLGHMAKKAGQGIVKGAQDAWTGVKDAGQQVVKGVQQAGTDIKHTYHAGEKNAALGKLEKVAAQLGQKVAAVNNHAKKAGQPLIDVQSILTTIKNQVSGKSGVANLDKYRTAEGLAEDGSIAVEEPIDNTGIETPINEEGIPVDSTEVQPMMGDAVEEAVDIKVSEKKGKALSADKAPEVEMKEGEEIEGEDVESEEEEDDVLDLSKRKEPEMGMHAGFEAMGGGVVKPEGAETTTVEVTKGAVNVTMNESEKKLRKYIRNRLEEKAGLRKPVLNEGVKSKTLKKLDRVIDKQFDLHETVALSQMGAVNEVFGWSFKEKFAKIDPNNPKEVGKLFYEAFRDILNNPQMGAIYNAAKQTSNEERYNILKQYVEQGDGTLRIGDTGVVFAPKAVKNAAIKSQFSQGGTQGKTQLGGV